MNDLMMASLGFVVKIAREYQHRGMPLEDLINEGNIGLIQASYRFELGGDRALTLREVGDLLRLSRERIRQIEIAALNKLRAAFHHAGFPIARKGTHRPCAS